MAGIQSNTRGASNLLREKGCPVDTGSMSVAVLVCTYNRSDDLDDLLCELRKEITRSGVQTRVIVVDNRSTDTTREVVARHSSECSSIEYYYEKVQGLGQARITGCDQVGEEEIIAMIDDDAVPDPGWLTNLVRAFEQNPRLGVTGGMIHPVWRSEVPTWLTRRQINWLTVNESDQPSSCMFPNYPPGANFVIRRKAYRQIEDEVRNINSELGHTGKKLLSGEDTCIAFKIQKRGWDVRYIPAISIHHKIVPGRLTRKWFASRYYWEGVSRARLDHLLKRRNMGTAFLYHAVRAGTGLMLLGLTCWHPRQRFFWYCTLLKGIGGMREATARSFS
jgi:glucosyl-dolichyl phosphate glucuronosyltransferase